MPRCSCCNKWGLFLKLQNGLCPSCYSKAAFYSMEFENQMRILTDSLAIIKKTKSIDTFNSRKELCLRAHAKMTEINNKYHLFPTHLLPSFGSILEACSIAESRFAKEDIENPIDMEKNYHSDKLDVLVHTEPEPSVDCPPISVIEDRLVSMHPKVQGFSRSFIDNPQNLDKYIEAYQKQISYFYEMKSLYTSKSSRHAKVWEKRFDHCFNSRKQDFCYIETSEEDLAYLIKRRSQFLNFEETILNTIRDNPGVLQKDLPGLIDANMSQTILSTVRDLAAANKITRVKNGRAYALYVTPGS